MHCPPSVTDEMFELALSIDGANCNFPKLLKFNLIEIEVHEEICYHRDHEKNYDFGRIIIIMEIISYRFFLTQNAYRIENVSSTSGLWSSYRFH